MKTVCIVYTDESNIPYRKFSINPESEEELREANEDVASFMNECYSEINDEEL